MQLFLKPVPPITRALLNVSENEPIIIHREPAGAERSDFEIKVMVGGSAGAVIGLLVASLALIALLVYCLSIPNERPIDLFLLRLMIYVVAGGTVIGMYCMATIFGANAEGVFQRTWIRRKFIPYSSITGIIFDTKYCGSRYHHGMAEIMRLRSTAGRIRIINGQSDPTYKKLRGYILSRVPEVPIKDDRSFDYRDPLN